MADEIIKRDENHRTVGAGISNDSTGDVIMLRVEPSSKYLLVTLDVSDAPVGNPGSIAKRDQNHVPVCLAYDEQNDQLVEVLTDDNGALLCDIVYI